MPHIALGESLPWQQHRGLLVPAIPPYHRDRHMMCLVWDFVMKFGRTMETPGLSNLTIRSNKSYENEPAGSYYSVQGEYKNDYQGYQSLYKTSGRSSSSSSTSSDASAENMSWDNSIGGGIAVWSLSAVAISLYALVGIRSFYRRYGDRDIYTGAGVPGGSRNSLAGMDDNANDKKVNLILPSGKELECENTVVSAMTGYPAPL